MITSNSRLNVHSPHFERKIIDINRTADIHKSNTVNWVDMNSQIKHKTIEKCNGNPSDESVVGDSILNSPSENTNIILNIGSENKLGIIGEHKNIPKNAKVRIKANISSKGATSKHSKRYKQSYSVSSPFRKQKRTHKKLGNSLA